MSGCDEGGDSDESSSLLSQTYDDTADDHRSNRKSPLPTYDAVPRPSSCNTSPYNRTEDAKYEYERISEDDDVESTLQSTSPSPEVHKTFSFFALSRQHKMILISISMADFLSYLCLSLLAPFFPKEAANKGVNDTISGWIFGVFALSQVLFSPLFGKLLPYVGIKFMYISGLFLSGGCTILFGIMAYVSVENGAMTFIILCFTLRIFLSVGCTGLNTACFAMCAKEFPDHIATVFGIGEVFVGIGFMSGPAVGGLLFGLGGFVLPFLVIGGLLLICVPINWIILPRDERYEAPESKTSSFVLLRSPSVIVASLAIVVASFIWSILDPTLEPHLRTFDLGPELIGVLFLVMSAFYAISSPIWGWVADKCPDNRPLLIPGFLFSAGGMILLGPSTLVGFPSDYNELWLNILALVILGISASLALIPTFDIIIDVAEELGFEDDMNTYGLVAGLWGSMYALGDFLGPSIGGTLLDTVGFSWCCTITAFACLSMIPILLLNYTCDKCHKRRSKIQENLSKANENGIVIATERGNSERTPLLNDSFKNPEAGDLLASYPPRVVTESV